MRAPRIGYASCPRSSGTQDPAVLQGMLAAAARTAEAGGEGVQSFKLFPDTKEEARQGGPHAFEGWEYYCTPRAQHPRSAKSLTRTSIDHIATFDAFRTVHLIAPRPLLMIVGRDAATSWMSVEASGRLVIDNIGDPAGHVARIVTELALPSRDTTGGSA